MLPKSRRHSRGVVHPGRQDSSSRAAIRSDRDQPGGTAGPQPPRRILAIARLEASCGKCFSRRDAAIAKMKQWTRSEDGKK